MPRQGILQLVCSYQLFQTLISPIKVQQPEIAALHDMNFGFSDKKLRPSNRVRKIAFGPDTGPFGNA
ncbi:hypothetical protein [Methanosarcina barkeri]|uniref:hypothetical protein n=1 Tax=Methanosarcina barkeri TaxID=2208 RepID=UPI00064F7DA8|nr:hypothetical protein [Methanosarcina barkeri]